MRWLLVMVVVVKITDGATIDVIEEDHYLYMNPRIEIRINPELSVLAYQ